MTRVRWAPSAAQISSGLATIALVVGCTVTPHYAPAEPSPHHVRVTFRNDAASTARAAYFHDASGCADAVQLAQSGIAPGASKTILLDREGDFSFSFGTFQTNVSAGVGIVGQAIYDMVDKPCPNRVDTITLEPTHEYVVYETRVSKTASSECELHVVDLVPQPDGSILEVPIELRKRATKVFVWGSGPICEPEGPLVDAADVPSEPPTP